MSSSSNIDTPVEVTPVSSVPVPPSKEEKPKKPSENALPWDHVDHEIAIKSFSGYTVKLNGWVRHDVREERQREREREEKEKATLASTPPADTTATN